MIFDSIDAYRLWHRDLEDYLKGIFFKEQSNIEIKVGTQAVSRHPRESF